MSSLDIAVPLGTLAAPAAHTLPKPHLISLVQAHDDLDAAIGALEVLGRDDLLIARLKKRKLALKDEIAHARAVAAA